LKLRLIILEVFTLRYFINFCYISLCGYQMCVQCGTIKDSSVQKNSNIFKTVQQLYTTFSAIIKAEQVACYIIKVCVNGATV